jgi:hypothetical protein
MQYLTKFLRESLTLQYHSELNPKFWVNIFLKEEVRKKLLEIAKEWLKFAEIPNSAVKDIVFTGGNANYNYTDDSDIDVHIILDKSKIPNCSDEEYFKDKKLIWSLTHDISVYGAEVEVYAQLGEVNIPKNQGVYSLKTGKWVVKPENLELDFEHDDLLKKKIDDAIYQIDHALENTTDTKAAEKLLEKFQKLRKHSIAKSGEFTQDNLVFKELRNRGYIDKIRKFIITMTDKKLSI